MGKFKQSKIGILLIFLLAGIFVLFVFIPKDDPQFNFTENQEPSTTNYLDDMYSEMSVDEVIKTRDERFLSSTVLDLTSKSLKVADLIQLSGKQEYIKNYILDYDIADLSIFTENISYKGLNISLLPEWHNINPNGDAFERTFHKSLTRLSRKNDSLALFKIINSTNGVNSGNIIIREQNLFDDVYKSNEEMCTSIAERDMMVSPDYKADFAKSYDIKFIPGTKFDACYYLYFADTYMSTSDDVFFPLKILFFYKGNQTSKYLELESDIYLNSKLGVETLNIINSIKR